MCLATFITKSVSCKATSSSKLRAKYVALSPPLLELFELYVRSGDFPNLLLWALFKRTPCKEINLGNQLSSSVWCLFNNLVWPSKGVWKFEMALGWKMFPTSNGCIFFLYWSIYLSEIHSLKSIFASSQNWMSASSYGASVNKTSGPQHSPCLPGHGGHILGINRGYHLIL